MLRRHDEAQLSRIACRLLDQFSIRQVVIAGGADLAPVNNETQKLGLAHRGDGIKATQRRCIGRRRDLSHRTVPGAI